MAVDQNIVSKLLEQLPTPCPCLEDLHIFKHWVIVKAARPAMATLFYQHVSNDSIVYDSYLGDLLGLPVDEIVKMLSASDDPLRMGVVMAALNASLPTPEGIFYGNAVEPFKELIKTCPSCFIGRFHQAAIWREQGYPVNIVELNPREGDIHWNESHNVLREAEIVFITGLTLINSTFRAVIDRTKRARYRVLLGPTVPCSTILFNHGVHMLGTTSIADVAAAIRYCQLGGTSIAKAPEGALLKVNLTICPELKP